MSQSHGAESAHKDRQPQCGKTRKREVGALATVPIRHLRQVRTLSTSACLKHSHFLKIDNWIGTCLTAVHMKRFSMKERVQRLGSTDTCPTAACEVSLTENN